MSTTVEQSFDAAGMFKDRLLDMIRRWEQASREDETEADTFRNGYLSGQNWAASNLRELLADVEQAEWSAAADDRFREALREGRF